MVSRTIVRGSVVLLVSMCFVVSCPLVSLAQTDVTLSVINGSVGYGLGVKGTSSFACSAGSQNPYEDCVSDGDCSGGTCDPQSNPDYPEANRIELSLENPGHDVRRLFADICSTGDFGSNLDFSGYEVSPRAEDLDHSITYNPGTKCIEVRFYGTEIGTSGTFYDIAAGGGPVAILYFNVSKFAFNGACADLDLGAVQVFDNADGGSLTHTDNDGQFCYYNCRDDQYCDNGFFCSGNYCFANQWCETPLEGACLTGVCDEGSDRCLCDNDLDCDDGLWCNGSETCNLGTGECNPGTAPCTDDNDPCTDDCTENGGGSCLSHLCNAPGPWDSCCQSSSVCPGAAVCNEEVTLTIGDGSGTPSSTTRLVDVSLANPDDAIKAVQVTICDADDYLTAQMFCTPTTRVPSGYGCECNEITNEEDPLVGCASCTLYDEFGTLDPVSAGTDPLFTVKYDVGPIGTVANGQCRDLRVNTEEPYLPTVLWQPIMGGPLSLVTMPVDGEFCITCTTGAGCNDGNPCTNEACVGGLCVYSNNGASCSDFDSCTIGDACVEADAEDSSVMMCGTKKCDVCKGTDRCPDNGGYCSGVEYCDGGACFDTGDPCGVTLSCNEGTDVCDVSDVTLAIVGATDREGVITLALDNNSDQVSEVHLDVCNVDQRDWFHISTDLCTTTGRASKLTCRFNGLCAVSGTPCSPTTQFTDCPMVCNNTGASCIDDTGCKECSLSGDPCVNPADCPGDECVDVGGTCDNCSNFDLGSGCVGVDVIAPFPLDRIETGSGAIAELTYTVDPVTILQQNYADLDPQNISVLDVGAVSLSVTPQPGKIDITKYCEGDFEDDGDVDAQDLTAFLTDFGRGGYFEPCENASPCNGDFICDGDVDAQDLTIFLEDFGRGFYNQPCPPALGMFDCVY